MSRLNSLKFILLHQLFKNKSKIDDLTHKEIAYSLKVSLKNNYFHVTWKIKDKDFGIYIEDKKFSFYIKSEFDEIPRREQIDENELSAEKLALEIIKKSIN